MKVMSYNILNGGNDVDGDRTEILLEIIRRESPDIIGFNECNHFLDDNRKRFHRFEEELGMKGVINEAQSGNHVAVFYGSDIDVIEASGRTTSMYNGYVRITADTEMMGRVAFVVTHLHPFSSVFRSGEMEIVVARAAKAAEAIVMGDMNSVAATDGPFDLVDAPRTMSVRLRGVSGEVDTQVTSIPLHRGYMDLGGKDPIMTYPTKLSEESSDPRVRLDYMFATPALAERCTNFRVDTSSAAHAASDHLPVIAEFEVA